MAKIIILDDNVDLLEMQAELLRAAGHEVTISSEGAAALAEIKTGGFALLVTDIIMPDMDGIEVIMNLRKLQPPIKIIAISGGGRVNPRDYLQLAVRLGVHGTLQKPFSGTELCLAVDRALHQATPPA
jgi:CheY-like chemotaxis protein